MISTATKKGRADETEKLAKLDSLEAEVASAGIPPSKFLPLFRKQLLATPDPKRALNNFLRFISSGFTSSLLRDFNDHPVLLTIALTLFSHSQYLADILVRSPELFHWLTSTDAVAATRKGDEYRRDAQIAIAPFERIDKKFDALKRFQRREILRISARDILKEADLATVTRELSWLADSIVDASVSIGLEDLAKRLGREVKSTFSVVGLGKLGGEELNFSSDIDLMFVYDEDGGVDFGAERIHSYNEYYCRIAEFVVRRLSEHTNEGHLYRIDMRLRPDGMSGPLAMSRAGYMRYYESRGDLWERQMLLKARIIAGNKDVGEGLLKDLRPFVYPSTVLHNPLEEIRSIKNRIESNLRGELNVKLSKGGIRDIEFVVQALQLMGHSAREEWKERNTLKAIEKLRMASQLSELEARHLRNGYEFLREVEHRLQLLHGTQTHELPANKEELRMLGKRMGFKTVTAFEMQLIRTQRQIRKIYDSVFQSRPRGQRDLRTRKELSSEDVDRMISRQRFMDTGEAVKIVQRLRFEVAQMNKPNILRGLLESLHRTGAPDWALKNFQTLSSSQAFVQSAPQILSNAHTLDLILKVCARSRRTARQLANEPLLFESFLGRTEDFFKPGVEWGFLLESDPARFRSFNEDKSMISYLAGESTIDQSARELTKTADAIVRSVIDELVDRFPNMQKRFCVIALGKYGGEEILVDSDLDLMILFQASESTDIMNEPENAAKEFVGSFSSDRGQLYDVDLRLRPEGKNAPLATEISFYEKYLNQRADIWEIQALLKARVVFGDGGLADKFEELRGQALAKVSRESGWIDRIRAMKEKMEQERIGEKIRERELKVGEGGLVDLEFVIQAIQLKHFARGGPADSVNSFEAIERIGRANLITKPAVAILRRNYIFLRHLELSIRLNSESKQFVIPEEKGLAQAIAVSVGERSPRSLTDRIQKVRKENRKLLKTVFEVVEK